MPGIVTIAMGVWSSGMISVLQENFLNTDGPAFDPRYVHYLLYPFSPIEVSFEAKPGAYLHLVNGKEIKKEHDETNASLFCFVIAIIMLEILRPNAYIFWSTHASCPMGSSLHITLFFFFFQY